MDLYERQLKWRDDAKKRAIANNSKEYDENDKELTFKPHIYTTTTIKKFEGSARELNEKSGVNHVRRQMKARKEKESILSKSKNFVSLLPVETEHEEYLEPEDHHYDQELVKSIDLDSELYGIPKDDSVPLSEESLIEMLERERRESHAERVKLIHCIHLQQIELTQRAVASHEKAAEIAKEFARAIEGFEERLLGIENNVTKEIAAIKSIAESLSTSTKQNTTTLSASTGSGTTSAKSSTNTGNTVATQQDILNMEKRLQTLENGINLILTRLDGLGHNIAQSSTNGPTTTATTLDSRKK